MGFRVSSRLSTDLSALHLDKGNQRLAHSIERLSSGVLTATSDTVPGESFTISKAYRVSILDASSLDQTAVRYGCDSGNHLDFFSNNTGSNNKTTLRSGGTLQGIGQKAFGIDFNLQVKASSLRFQVGTRKGHTIGSQIGDVSPDFLGLKGLDITTMETATRALTAIDNAVSCIAQNKTRLGVMQLRMLSSVLRTEDASLHHSASQ